MTGEELAEYMATELPDRALNANELAALVTKCRACWQDGYAAGKRDADLATVAHRANGVKGGRKR